MEEITTVEDLSVKALRLHMGSGGTVSFPGEVGGSAAYEARAVSHPDGLLYVIAATDSAMPMAMASTFRFEDLYTLLTMHGPLSAWVVDPIPTPAP